MHKPPATVPTSKPATNEISFTTLPQEEYTTDASAVAGGEAGAQQGVAAGSEGGFFFSDVSARGGRIATGVCKVTGARGFLRFGEQ